MKVFYVVFEFVLTLLLRVYLILASIAGCIIFAGLLAIPVTATFGALQWVFADWQWEMFVALWTDITVIFSVFSLFYLAKGFFDYLMRMTPYNRILTI